VFLFLSVEINACFVLSINLSNTGFSIEMENFFSSSFVSSTRAVLRTAVLSRMGYSLFSSSTAATGPGLGSCTGDGVTSSIVKTLSGVKEVSFGGAVSYE